MFTEGPIYIIIAAVLWAVDGVIRRSLYSLPPLHIVFYEHLIGMIILIPFLWTRLRKERLTQREYGVIALVSLFSGLLGTLWFTTALSQVHFISFSVVFLLQKLQPIFAISTATLFLKERVNRKYVIWAAAAVVAAYFVTFKNGYVDLKTGSGTVTAALYALGAAFAWGASTTFSRMALKKHSHVVITGLRFVMTTVMAAVALVIFTVKPFATVPSSSQLALLVTIALSTGMVALMIYYRGLRKTEVRVSTILELTFPILAIFIDAFMYKSYLSVTQYLAAGILLYCMYRIALLNSKTNDTLYIQESTG